MKLLPEFQKFMGLRNGHPTLYHQFLSHILLSNSSDIVFPLPMPSVVASRVLAALEWTVDIVYVDSAHELDETHLELEVYHSLLRKGGLLMGDDYHSFPAVHHDVDIFVRNKNLSLEVYAGDQWLIKKPH